MMVCPGASMNFSVWTGSGNAGGAARTSFWGRAGRVERGMGAGDAQAPVVSARHSASAKRTDEVLIELL